MPPVYSCTYCINYNFIPAVLSRTRVGQYWEEIQKKKEKVSMSENLFEQRVRIANQAIAHEEPERIPIWINYGSTPHILNEDPEATFKDTFYCRERAKRSIIKFHEEFQPDVQLANLFSGKAEEIAGTKYIDWPGRSGTRNPDTSIYQVHEYEFCKTYDVLDAQRYGWIYEPSAV